MSREISTRRVGLGAPAPTDQFRAWTNVYSLLVGRPPGEMPQSVMDEAVAIQQGLDALGTNLRRMSADDMLEWLRPLSAAVKNPPSDEMMETRAAASAFACAGEYPAYLFDARAQQLAMQMCEFWPSVREIVAVAQARRKELEDLSRVVWGLIGQ